MKLKLLLIILLTSCAPEPAPKCIRAELMYDTYWNGSSWQYYPVSVCKEYSR